MASTTATHQAQSAARPTRTSTSVSATCPTRSIAFLTHVRRPIDTDRLSPHPSALLGHALSARRSRALPLAIAGAAAKAKASGLLRNWGATDKYTAAEPLVLQAHASLEEDEELDEEALLDFAPQLSEFEAETLQTLLAQSRRHGDYELAARTLLVRPKDSTLNPGPSSSAT